VGPHQMKDTLIGFSPSGKKKDLIKTERNLKLHEKHITKYLPRDGSKGYIPPFLRRQEIQTVKEASSCEPSSESRSSE
jgi:hypothetical protein